MTEEGKKVPKHKRHWDKIVAVVLAAVAIALLVYALTTEETTTEDTTTHGMWDQRTYSSTNLAVIVAASFLIAIAVMFILLRQSYEPLPPEMTKLPPPPPPAAAPPGEQPARVPDTAIPAQAPVETEAASSTPPAAPEENLAARENYLVLRLLTGDERIMFKAVMDSGGEALQKDLILRTKMSNAKVSRLLDRLEEKGVVTKVRHGSTNKVRIKLEQ